MAIDINLKAIEISVTHLIPQLLPLLQLLTWLEAVRQILGSL